ncbi:hypothetical protein BGX28_008330 [Mortierella sp. GBA30]|nr:hypothetical protein BGX28_008330 [Mortierella sp. GBA30]
MVKSSSTAPYCFVSGQSRGTQTFVSSHKYVLSIRQQPQQAKVCGAKERDRRPIDPPPIVQIKLAHPSSDRNSDYLQSPYLFMCCNLVHAEDPSGEIVAPAHRALAGTVVSSLNRLKDVDNSDGGFFVFGDMSVRIEGRFRLRFTLFELVEGRVIHLMTTISNTLTVHSSKTFPGMSESTFLSRSFSDQGVRIRIRKDHHVKPKRPLSMDTVDHPQARALYSPPSSCHEEYLSDNEPSARSIVLSSSVKRVRTLSSRDDTDPGHFSSSSYAKYDPMGRHASTELAERTPPSSPESRVVHLDHPLFPKDAAPGIHNPVDTTGILLPVILVITYRMTSRCMLLLVATIAVLMSIIIPMKTFTTATAHALTMNITLPTNAAVAVRRDVRPRTAMNAFRRIQWA